MICCLVLVLSADRGNTAMIKQFLLILSASFCELVKPKSFFIKTTNQTYNQLFKLNVLSLCTSLNDFRLAHKGNNSLKYANPENNKVKINKITVINVSSAEILQKLSFYTNIFKVHTKINDRSYIIPFTLNYQYSTTFTKSFLKSYSFKL